MLTKMFFAAPNYLMAFAFCMAGTIMAALTIAHVTIQQDENGRYSLNDLYRASGSNPKNKPSEWMRNKQTKALIDELISERGISASNSAKNKAGIPAYSVTQKSGAYVAKELVYAYAMWVSPAFNLKVIRAYDALVRGDLAAVNDRLYKIERAYFKKYPNDQTIRDMAYRGEPYWFIGSVVRRTAQTVGKAILRMIGWGILDANRLRIARIGMGPWWAHRRKNYGQLSLFT